MRRGAGFFGGFLDYLASKTVGRFIPKIPMPEKQKPMDAPGKAVKQFIPNMRDGMIQVADAGARIGMASGGVSIYTELTYQERHSILGIEFWGGKQTEYTLVPNPGGVPSRDAWLYRSAESAMGDQNAWAQVFFQTAVQQMDAIVDLKTR